MRTHAISEKMIEIDLQIDLPTEMAVGDFVEVGDHVYVILKKFWWWEVFEWNVTFTLLKAEHDSVS